MELERSLLQIEVDQITQSDPIQPGTFTLTLITPVARHDVFKLLAWDRVRHYHSHTTEDATVEVVIGRGTHQYHVIPYKDDLYAEITWGAPDGEHITHRYRALVLGASAEHIQQNTLAAGAAVGDTLALDVVVLQLRELAWELLQTTEVGGTFRSITPGHLLRGLLTQHLHQPELDEVYQLQGVEMQPPDNTMVRQQIPIDHGTRLVDVGDVLQSKEGGIYSAGLGVFLQDGYWYLWSVYDLYYRHTRSLRVVVIPSNRWRGAVKSWRMNGSELVILAAGAKKHIDPTDQEQYNGGNAVRFLDANRVMGDYATVKGNRAVVNRTQNTSEYIGVQRRSGYQYARTVAPTDNPYAQASVLSKRQGSYLMVTWERSYAELIQPDMTVTVVTERDGQVYEYAARIVSVHHYLFNATEGLVLTNHQHNSTLTLFVENAFPEDSIESE